MGRFTWKSAAPYLTAVVLFIVFSALYFSPQYSGRALQMSDMVQHQGMTRDINDHIAAYGEHPQWEGAMFGGMPAYLINMNYEGRLVKDAGQALGFMGQPAAFFFVAMFCFYVMLLLFGVNPWIAIVGAFGYGLSTYFYIIVSVGHITKMLALAFAPGIVGGVWYTYRKNIWLGAALTALFAALELGANHIQITYYFLYILLALFINEIVHAARSHTWGRFAKATVVLAAAALLAAGANFNQLYYIASHSKYTMRGGSEISGLSAVKNSETSEKGLDLSYATQWSYGRWETLNLLVPNLMGGSSSGGFTADGEVAGALKNYNAAGLATKLPAYWGPQPFTAGPVYIGAVLIFLFVLGMFILRGGVKWWLFGVTVLSILLAWGHNLMWLTELFYNYVPFYNKFRTVSMILVIAEFTVPLLAVLTLQAIFSGEVSKERFRKAMNSTGIIVGGVLIALFMIGGNLFEFSSPADSQFPIDVVSALHQERLELLRSDVIRSLIYVVLTAALVWFVYNKKIKSRLGVVLMLLLVVVDIAPVDWRFLNHDSFVAQKQQQPLQPTGYDLKIQEDTEPGYRVANLAVNTFNDATTSNFHRSVGGYHPAKLSRYQDLIDRYLSRGDLDIYNMLNTKYIITANDKNEVMIQQNPNNLGAVWFIDDISEADSPDTELERLNEVNLRRTAVVNPEFRALIDKDMEIDSVRKIELVDYRVNNLTYKYNNSHKSVAVFSEIYFPEGWSATIDGAPAPYFRANYLLRAMSLPAGEHTVVFHFEAPHFKAVTGVTYASSILIFLCVIAAGWVSVACARRCNENKKLS